MPLFRSFLSLFVRPVFISLASLVFSLFLYFVIYVFVRSLFRYFFLAVFLYVFQSFYL